MGSEYSAVPPGWYPDPENPGERRYWDGSAWTPHRAPVTATTPRQPSKPMSPRAKLIVGFGVVGLAIAAVAGYQFQEARRVEWQPPPGYTKVNDLVAVNLTSDPGYVATYVHQGCPIDLSITIDIPANYGTDRFRTLRSNSSVRPGTTYLFEYPPDVTTLSVINASCA